MRYAQFASLLLTSLTLACSPGDTGTTGGSTSSTTGGPTASASTTAGTTDSITATGTPTTGDSTDDTSTTAATSSGTTTGGPACPPPPPGSAEGACILDSDCKVPGSVCFHNAKNDAGVCAVDCSGDDNCDPQACDPDFHAECIFDHCLVLCAEGCPDGLVCDPLTGSCLWPHEPCKDVGPGLPGGPCHDDLSCDVGQCEKTPSGAACTQSCVTSSDCAGYCPPLGFDVVCAESQCVVACEPGPDACPVGMACDPGLLGCVWPDDCAPDLKDVPGADYGSCDGLACDGPQSNCFDLNGGNVCAPNCRVDADCDIPGDCDAALCLDGACVVPCSPTDDCPVGMACDAAKSACGWPTDGAEETDDGPPEIQPGLPGGPCDDGECVGVQPNGAPNECRKSEAGEVCLEACVVDGDCDNGASCWDSFCAWPCFSADDCPFDGMACAKDNPDMIGAQICVWVP